MASDLKPKPKPTHHPPAGADPVGHGLCPALRPPAPPSPAPQGAQDRLGTSRTPRTAPNEPSPALACGPALPRRKGWVGFFLGGGELGSRPQPYKGCRCSPRCRQVAAASVFWRPGAQPRSPRRQAHPAPLCGTPALSSPLVGVGEARLPVRGGAGFHRLLSFPPPSC